MNHLKQLDEVAIGIECSEILRCIIASHPALIEGRIDENELLDVAYELNTMIKTNYELKKAYAQNEWGK